MAAAEEPDSDAAAHAIWFSQDLVRSGGIEPPTLFSMVYGHELKTSIDPIAASSLPKRLVRNFGQQKPNRIGHGKPHRCQYGGSLFFELIRRKRTG